MSIQETYIKELLKNEYSECETFRDKKNLIIKSYEHRETQKKLIYIETRGNNDAVFRILKSKNLNNLPIIYDACCGDSSVIVLEEYICGKNLAEIMDTSVLPEKLAVKYCLDVCKALKCLHNNGIIHRDIKPLNVIINENDEAVLIDLHSARIISKGKENDTYNLGTAGYAAPEQYGVYQSSPATDIFALGVMLNEMLLRNHPSVRVPKGKLGQVIKKCTNIQILQRYQSVDELVKDLRKISRHNLFRNRK